VRGKTPPPRQDSPRRKAIKECPCASLNRQYRYQEYDESLGTEDVHYQSFARMAAFFGRDMQAHRHDQYFQMHFLDTGQIELQLDDHRYSVQAPLFVLTPPSVPHAFHRVRQRRSRADGARRSDLAAAGGALSRHAGSVRPAGDLPVAGG
jgi:mannose-6-phosphate isomerase-like protein (cupin superfamily)